MSFGNWFRRLFASSRVGAGDTLAPSAPDEMIGAPGVSGFASLEDAAAVEAVEKSTDAPSDPAS